MSARAQQPPSRALKGNSIGGERVRVPLVDGVQPLFEAGQLLGRPVVQQLTTVLAHSRTVQRVETVAQPIEQQVNGVQDMMYMSSECGNDGSYCLTITFSLGTDIKMAQVLVQNRVSLALPSIPPLVQKQGVAVKKSSPSTLMIVNLLSEIDKQTGEPIYDELRR